MINNFLFQNMEMPMYCPNANIDDMKNEKQIVMILN
jgi:hypothetical protein